MHGYRDYKATSITLKMSYDLQIIFNLKSIVLLQVDNLDRLKFKIKENYAR